MFQCITSPIEPPGEILDKSGNILLHIDNPSERKDDVQQERSSVSSAQPINVTVKVKHIHQSDRLSSLISLSRDDGKGLR